MTTELMSAQIYQPDVASRKILTFGLCGAAELQSARALIGQDWVSIEPAVLLGAA